MYYLYVLSPPQRTLFFSYELGNGERLKVSVRSLGRWGNKSLRGHWEGRKREERPCSRLSALPDVPCAAAIFHFLWVFFAPSTERASVEERDYMFMSTLEAFW